MRSCWTVAIVVTVLLVGAMSLGGYALARSSSGPKAARLATIPAFCSAHTSAAGFWFAYGSPPQPSFSQLAVDAARTNHRQFEAVAGTLCAMLHRIRAGHAVQLPGAGTPAQAHRQILQALRKLSRLSPAD